MGVNKCQILLKYIQKGAVSVMYDVEHVGVLQSHTISQTPLTPFLLRQKKKKKPLMQACTHGRMAKTAKGRPQCEYSDKYILPGECRCKC